MTEIQTVSWIFISTALASEKSPASLAGISAIADGINHAVPTERELLGSLEWLRDQGLVTKSGSAYTLTEKGKASYKKASAKTSVLLRVWERTEKILEKMSHDDRTT